jgi:hypothetical protein
MKVAGVIVAVFGGLMVLSGLNLALTKYDLSSSHDLSEFLGAMGVSIVIIVVGLVLYTKGSKATPK